MIANKDIAFVKSILPKHYTVEEGVNLGSITCVSKIGIDDGNEKKWDKVMRELKKHFGSRFDDIFHIVNPDHVEFSFFLEP